MLDEQYQTQRHLLLEIGQADYRRNKLTKELEDTQELLFELYSQLDVVNNNINILMAERTHQQPTHSEEE